MAKVKANDAANPNKPNANVMAMQIIIQRKVFMISPFA